MNSDNKIKVLPIISILLAVSFIYCAFTWFQNHLKPSSAQTPPLLRNIVFIMALLISTTGLISSVGLYLRKKWAFYMTNGILSFTLIVMCMAIYGGFVLSEKRSEQPTSNISIEESSSEEEKELIEKKKRSEKLSVLSRCLKYIWPIIFLMILLNLKRTKLEFSLPNIRG